MSALAMLCPTTAANALVNTHWPRTCRACGYYPRVRAPKTENGDWHVACEECGIVVSGKRRQGAVDQWNDLP